MTFDNWEDHFMREFSDAYIRIADQDDGYYSSMEYIQSQIYELRKYLPKVLLVCIDKSARAYSDGNSETFVSDGQQLVIFHQLGFPD